MTGKQLSDFQRQILGRLFQIQKLTNRDIAGVLDVDERTIRRRRDEWKATGEIRAHKDVSKNAEKFKPEAVMVCDVHCLLPSGASLVGRLIDVTCAEAG